MFAKIFSSNLSKTINVRSINQNWIHTTPKDCAGHSKWQNIRHIKALKDGQRGVLFTKLSRQIRLAIVEGGGSTDTKLNSQLSNIVDHAIKQNMPRAQITNILTKHDKKDPKMQLKHGLIELKMKTAKNAFVLLSMVTDNLGKTKNEANSVIRRSGLFNVMMCKHMFTEKGVITTKLLPSFTLDKTMEHAIEVGAEDVEMADGIDSYIQFITEAHMLNQIKTRLEAKGYEIDNYEKVYTPNALTQLSEVDQKNYENFKTKVLALEGIDDVHDNIEYTEN